MFSGGSSVCTVVGVCNNTVADDEHSVSTVRCINGTSWNNNRLDGISVTLKVLADAFKGKGRFESVSVKCVTLVE